MTEPTTTTVTDPGAETEVGQAVAVIRVEAPPAPVARAPRELRVTNDAFAVLDTAKFEHMQRVAEIMAVSNLTPETLVGERKGDDFFPFSREVARANCFMVVDFAVTARASPFAVAQAVSVVRGKLMFEGKLIHAILEGRYGIGLRYTFNDAAGKALAVRAFNPKAPEEFVEGTVADWETDRSGSPWKSPANWRRMLRYRSAREWARAYQPGAILGVYSDDEVEDMVDRRERIADARPGAQALGGEGARKLTGGFPDAQVKIDPRQAGKDMAERVAEVVDAVEGAQATAEAALDKAQGSVQAEEKPAEEKPAPKKRGRPSNAEKAARAAEAAAEGEVPPASASEAGPLTDGAQAAESAPAASASATDASAGSPDPAAASGQIESSDKSTLSADALAIEVETGEHVEPDAAAAALDEMAAAESDAFPGDKVIEEREARENALVGQAQPSTTVNEAIAQAETPDAVQRRAVFAAYSDTVERATTFAAITQALKALAVTEAWKSSEVEAQRMARLDAWDRLQQLIESGEEANFAWRLDIQAVKLWLDIDPSSTEIASIWAKLREAPSYTGLAEASRAAYGRVIAEALAAARKRDVSADHAKAQAEAV